jgi:hypothetical protein
MSITNNPIQKLELFPLTTKCNVLAEVGGHVISIPGTNFNAFKVVKIDLPPDNMYFRCDAPFKDLYNLINTGGILLFVYTFFIEGDVDGTKVEYATNIWCSNYTTGTGYNSGEKVDYIEIMFTTGGMRTLYYCSDGIISESKPNDSQYS